MAPLDAKVLETVGEGLRGVDGEVAAEVLADIGRASFATGAIGEETGSAS